MAARPVRVSRLAFTAALGLPQRAPAEVLAVPPMGTAEGDIGGGVVDG